MKKILAYVVFAISYLALLFVADIDSIGEVSLLILTVTSAQVYTRTGRGGELNGG